MPVCVFVCVRSATEDVGGAGWSFSKPLPREILVFCLDLLRGARNESWYSRNGDERRACDRPSIVFVDS